MINQKQKQKNMNVETTFRIDGIKPVFRGYRVIVGKTMGNGMYDLVKGNKKEAQEVAKVMKGILQNSLFKQDKLCVCLEPVKLSKCKTDYCDRLCENDETYCMRCDDLMFEARMEYQELKNEVLENER
jgi:hypothetical protein